MYEREKIQNSLESNKLLATLSNNELLELADDPQKFDEFIEGIAYCITPRTVCYLYNYNDILSEMIKKNTNRDLDENKVYNIYKVLVHLKEFGDRDKSYREDFGSQYEFITSHIIGLNKMNLSIKDLNAHMSDMFRQINTGDISQIKTDKYYLLTVSYLANYHLDYLHDSFMYLTILDSLSSFKRENFPSHEEYRKFKKLAHKTFKTCERFPKETKQTEKVKKKI